MSEYQYYEFQAIDRRLSAREMEELRARSTRAQITPTSFINEYSFGSFKGDQEAWMEHYFDAFLYLANWGTHLFMLRLPAGLIPLPTARQYCPGHSASVREKSGKLIFSFVSDEEPEDGWVEGGGWLNSLLPVREEIARGDLRALYLGWLASVQQDPVDEGALEPPVPANLGHLSTALSRLADFLRINPDLLAVAAESSPSTQSKPGAADEDLAGWLGQLPPGEKDRVLLEVMRDQSAAVGMALWSRFHRERPAGPVGGEAPRRTVKTLLSAAESQAAKRQREEARKAAAEMARQAREAAAAREKYLDSITGREPELWAQVEQLTAARLGKSYDLAVQHLLDLRDLAGRTGTQPDFADRLAKFRQAHARKSSIRDRLLEKGL